MGNKKLIISLFVTAFIVLVGFGVRIFYLADSDPVRALEELTAFIFALFILFSVVTFFFGWKASFGFLVFLIFVVSMRFFVLEPLVNREVAKLDSSLSEQVTQDKEMNFKQEKQL